MQLSYLFMILELFNILEINICVWQDKFSCVLSLRIEAYLTTTMLCQTAVGGKDIHF